MPRITPMLWFDRAAEEAANFYVSVFPNSKITGVSHYVEDAHGKVGDVLTVSYELDGQPYVALNGGPQFKFSEAVSLVIDCKDQAEIDYYWDRLREGGGEESMCGWLKDRYGFSWQVTPADWADLIHSPDKAAVRRAMEAMYGMRKLDIARLREAFNG